MSEHSPDSGVDAEGRSGDAGGLTPTERRNRGILLLSIAAGCIGTWLSAYWDQPWMLVLVTVWLLGATAQVWRTSPTWRGSLRTGRATFPTWLCVLLLWLFYSLVLLFPFFIPVARVAVYGLNWYTGPENSTPALDFGNASPLIVDWTHWITITNAALVPILIFIRVLIGWLPPREN